MTEKCKYEKEIVDMLGDAKATRETVNNLSNRINGSYTKIKDHVEEGKGWRVAIFMACTGIIIQIVVASFMWGNLNASVKNNTKQIDRVLTTIERINHEESQSQQ